VRQRFASTANRRRRCRDHHHIFPILEVDRCHMPRERSHTRPATLVAVLFKTFFVNFYAALDKTQRERAAKIIRQYGHLISKSDDSSDEKRKMFFSSEPSFKPRQLSAVIVWHDGC
jgi:hypothetical protein